MRNESKFLFWLMALLFLMMTLGFLVDKCQAQDYFEFGDGFDFGSVVTDSVVWRVINVENIGDTTCHHDWVYSKETDPSKGICCDVLHYGFHCDWHDLVRYRICRICLRKEKQKEFWYQHRYEPPKSEYEMLDERLRKK